MPSALLPVPSMAIRPRSCRVIQWFVPPPFIHTKTGPGAVIRAPFPSPDQTEPWLFVPNEIYESVAVQVAVG